MVGAEVEPRSPALALALSQREKGRSVRASGPELLLLPPLPWGEGWGEGVSHHSAKLPSLCRQIGLRQR